jgi:beta-galactosidase
MITKPDKSWLSDPRIFEVNRLAAHSDHEFYEGVDTPLKQSLNGVWQFRYGDSRETGTIEVPGHMQLQGYGKPQYCNTQYPWDGVEQLSPPQIPSHNPVGHYEKTFVLAGNLKNKDVRISFGGVETAFYVYLNDNFVGYSEDSFMPGDFDITRFLRDGENKLAISVYKYSSASWLQDQDFWRFSGIFREVFIYAIPKIHLFDIAIKPMLCDDYTTGSLTANLTIEGENGSYAAALYDADGTLVANIKSPSPQMDFTLECDNINAWSAESPYLYKLVIQLFDMDDNLVETSIVNVGFRRFEIIDKVMCLNGERIVFHGVNRHEWSAKRGRAITEDDMLWDIRFLKENNINAIRTSHYPNQFLWYKLCDKYGIYVIDEANLESHGTWQKMGVIEPSENVPGSLGEWREAALDRARSMYERDKNHPSILIWSCGNESYVGDNIVDIAAFLHERDNSRLVHYEGVSCESQYRHIVDMESHMYWKPKDIEAYLQNNPDKPYISCEFMHAMGNSCGGLSLYIELENKYPMYQGGFIWEFIDQAILGEDGELKIGGDFGERPHDGGFCADGIVYADRTPSPKVQEVRALYA